MTYSQAATNDTSQGRRRSGGSPRGPTIPRIESRSWTGWKSRVSGVVTEWSYRDLRSQGLRTRLAQRGPDKLLAAGKTLSLSLFPRPFFKGVTHVAATCSPLDWPRQDLRTGTFNHVAFVGMEEQRREKFWSFEQVSKKKFWIAEKWLCIFSNFAGFYFA